MWLDLTRLVNNERKDDMAVTNKRLQMLQLAVPNTQRALLWESARVYYVIRTGNQTGGIEATAKATPKGGGGNKPWNPCVHVPKRKPKEEKLSINEDLHGMINKLEPRADRHKAAPIEALYGRKYRITLLGLKLGISLTKAQKSIHETTEKFCSKQSLGSHTFHVSKLKKCMADEPLAIPLDEIQIDEKLHFIEEPIEIMDRELTIPDIKAEMETTLQWLVPIATNTAKGGLMRFAITGAWRELCESMEAAGYFDEVIEMHDAYLLSNKHQCFGAIAACALPWLKSLPLQHASFIMSEEASLIALNSLYQVLSLEDVA
ncbi:putative reverse transcriptase domain-containing protein [Tanacetum coccineum]